MHRLSLLASRVFTVLLAAASFACAPVTTAQDYTPTVGQEGKDVIWVPTPQSLVDKMLDMAKLTPKDIHYDLGSGDGRTVITAAKRGAQAYGVEFNPDMVKLSERAAAKEGVSARAKFINGDIFQTDFSQATVITLYLLPSLNVKLRPTILKMKPGTRVVSHAFSMEDWQADETATVEGRTAYLWIVPAQVNGRWQMPAGGELTLKQSYQMISGVLRQGGKESIVKGQLSGERITFATDADGGRREFSGQVSGNAMQGTVKGSAGAGQWSATRADK
ncbi:MAG TPA: class I SAM-dependent methyltransferase [Burkholderiales bacterium]|nr:class I SAM-dependent methyltransferase [Burkholderiales bacterium]